MHRHARDPQLLGGWLVHRAEDAERDVEPLPWQRRGQEPGRRRLPVRGKVGHEQEDGESSRFQVSGSKLRTEVGSGRTRVSVALLNLELGTVQVPEGST